MRIPRSVILILVATLTFGCTKKSQRAVVIAMEHIPARVEGAEYKERQTDRDRWLVKVEMESGRKAEADVDEALWQSLKVGDRVHAEYSEGNYTGTTWVVELRKP
ncbi:MAG: hypothetical protein ABMA13_16570 [Chthoniobacteraceae bacterium]